MIKELSKVQLAMHNEIEARRLAEVEQDVLNSCYRDAQSKIQDLQARAEERHSEKAALQAKVDGLQVCARVWCVQPCACACERARV